MEIQPDMKVVAASATTSGVSTVIGFFSHAIPILQVVSLLVAIVSGILGIFWIAFQFRRAMKAQK